MKAEKKIKINYYPNGKILSRSEYIGNVRNGFREIFGADGSTHYYANYKNDKLHGPSQPVVHTDTIVYWLYGRKVSDDEYHKHILIEKMSGL